MDHHFQSLELSDMIIAIDNSPDLEITRRDPQIVDDSLVIVRGDWTKKHRLNRMEWIKLGLVNVEYKENIIHVNSVNNDKDLYSVEKLLELIGRPSKFRYTKNAMMIFRYDRLHDQNHVEETNIRLMKYGRRPWLLNHPELDELKKLVENYPLPASVSRR